MQLSVFPNLVFVKIDWSLKQYKISKAESLISFEGEINKSSKDIYMNSVGKYNPRDHLETTVEELVTDNLNTCLTSMLNNLVF